MFFLNRKKNIVGIDIGSSSIKLVQIKEVKGRFRLLHAGIIPLPAEAIVDNTLVDRSSIVDAIKRVTSFLPVEVNDAASSISGNSVIIRNIFLPTMSSEELEERIVREAGQYIPFDIKDVNIDFQILGPDARNPSKMEVLLVASKKEIINDYVAIFNEAGLRLAVVDVDSFAVQNAFEINHGVEPGKVIALINIGAGMMNINVVKDGVRLFSRDVQMGGDLYTEEIQKQMGVGRAEAEMMKMSVHGPDESVLTDIMDQVNDVITKEIHHSLDYHNSTADEDRVARIFLSGGCSKVHNLSAKISAKMALQAELINPFARLEYNEDDFDPQYLQEIGLLMVVPVGLALRRVLDK